MNSILLKRALTVKESSQSGLPGGHRVMIGLPHQTEEDLVNDILFYRDMDIDMIGMGPYVVHHDTPLGQEALAMGIDDEAGKNVVFSWGSR